MVVLRVSIVCAVPRSIATIWWAWKTYFSLSYTLYVHLAYPAFSLSYKKKYILMFLYPTFAYTFRAFLLLSKITHFLYSCSHLHSWKMFNLIVSFSYNYAGVYVCTWKSIFSKLIFHLQICMRVLEWTGRLRCHIFFFFQYLAK